MKRIAACIGVTCAIGVASAQSDSKRIIPGKQLGKLSIGNLIEDMKWLKKADYGDAGAGLMWQTWDAKKPDPRNGKIINSLDVYSSVNEAGKFQIRAIRSTSPTFSTTDKIRVGSLYKEVSDEFGKLEKVADYDSPQFAGKVALYDDTAAGIAFEFKIYKAGAVGLHSPCLAVWVHEPGNGLMSLRYPPVKYLAAKPKIKLAAKQL